MVVDLRRGSSTYAKHISVELSEDNGCQMLVPKGFAHGFCTLMPSTLVLYKVDSFYDSTRDSGIRWDDPTLNISWPIPTEKAVVSEKDLNLPLFNDAQVSFEIDGADV